MKNISIFFFLCSILLFLSCDSDDNSPNCQGIDCLPPATQTGVGTFGCLVNGEPYYAVAGLNAQYQFINGNYFFLIGFDNDVGFPESISVIGIGQLTTSNNLILDLPDDGYYGKVIFGFDDENFEFIQNTTDSVNTGTLRITKLDIQNRIFSGTFEFDVLNPEDGQLYQIREGRFDSFYTQ